MAKSKGEKIVGSVIWKDLKELLEEHQQNAVALMIAAPTTEELYSARGRYKVLSELINLEQLYIKP